MLLTISYKAIGSTVLIVNSIKRHKSFKLIVK